MKVAELLAKIGHECPNLTEQTETDVIVKVAGERHPISDVRLIVSDDALVIDVE